MNEAAWFGPRPARSRALLAALAPIVLAGCGLERIDFEPTPFVPDAGVDAGPPPPRPDYAADCRGSGPTCDGLSQAACEATPECSYVGACAMRSSFRCVSLDTAQQCLQVPGCRWDSVIDACAGFPATDTCEPFAPASCAVAAACEVVDSPRCVPKRGCSQVSVAECASVAGCTPGCNGSETLCGDRCADLQTSPNHCGACGAFCPGRCEGGRCFAFAACTSDVECVPFDDHNACTGEVRCVDGGCQRTRPPVCDDGVECTLDRCDPATGMCSHQGRDGYCALNETCDAAAGCVLEPACTSTSCPGGEVCVDTVARTYCAPEGESAAGAVCDSPLDCADGLECGNVARDDVFGICGSSCRGDSDCPGGRCVSGACSVRCSLVADDTVCGPSLRCQHTSVGATVCVDNRGAVGEGAPCTAHQDCERGHLCILTGTGTGSAFCRAACDYDGTRACPSRRCVTLEPALVINGREYGACL